MLYYYIDKVSKDKYIFRYYTTFKLKITKLYNFFYIYKSTFTFDYFVSNIDNLFLETIDYDEVLKSIYKDIQNYFINSSYNSLSRLMNFIKLKDEIIPKIKVKEKIKIKTKKIIKGKVKNKIVIVAVTGKEYKLYDYQEEIVWWMGERESITHRGIKGGIISAEMGLGKTFIALYHSLNSGDNIYPTLIVVSLTLLDNWVTDGVEKFFPNNTYLVVHKTYFKSKYDNYDTFLSERLLDVDIVITTYDVCITVCRVNDLFKDILIKGTYGIETDKIIGYKQINKPHINNKVEGPLNLYNIPWTRVICDESQKFSNKKTKTFQSVLRLYGDYKWCLTGTPIKNTYLDIWSQLVFCKYYSTNSSKTSVTGKKWDYRVFNQEKLIESIYQISFENVDIELPEKIINYEYIDMNEEQYMHYKLYLGELKENIKLFQIGKIKEFTIILELFLRLRQICISPTIVKIDDEVIRMTSKIDSILNLVKKYHKSEKILVFSAFQDVLDLFGDVFNHNKITYSMLTGKITNTKERVRILNNFKQMKNNNVLLINYKVGSEGLNITEASRVILIEPWWNSATHEQAIARAWRIGQTKPVNVHYFLNNKSIEIRIMELNLSKNEQRYNLLNNTGEMNSKITIGVDTILDMIKDF